MTKNDKLSEKDIALDLLAGSKASIGTLVKAITETTNPELKKTLKNQLTACINSHHRLSDIAISKGWYNAFANPQEQLQSELGEVGSVTQ